MKGQSYIIEYILMFGIAFLIFSTISYIFYKQTDYISSRMGMGTAKIINRAVAGDMIKIFTCKSCSYIELYPDVPQKIGNNFYNITIENNVTVKILRYQINTTSLNIDKTFDLSGNINSNKKIKVEINNITKSIKVV
ncbi:MAG: hypothetical protein QXM68_02660 [Candidatus Aenigmatarchaeota archaeon]|nr:hypothetical protein [Candidatus Aenigmarchaeota archaeon]